MKNSYCTLHLIRHGETEFNLAKRLQGHMDSPLTEKGKTQATEIGKKLQHIPFAAVYTSDLTRAKHTAKLITLERNMEIKTTQMLREKAYGSYEGRLFQEYEIELKNMLAKYSTLVDEEKRKFKFAPDMESDEEAIGRYITYLREIAISHLGEHVLVVGHGGILKVLLIHLGYGSYKDFPSGAVQNCAHIVLESDGTDFIIKEVEGVTRLNI